jgi:hypothetical protein
MSDEGKRAAIEELRREVGFGCPVCRSPFLTWHHFDPPWEVEHHWRPDGMIALCLEHHPNADPEGIGGNAYSPDELRRMKRKSYSLEEVKANFPSWQKKNILVRIGGCYASPSMPVLSVSGVPQISVRRNEVGLLALSFQLRDKSDAVLVEMVDNWFTAYPSNVHDMTVKPKTRDVKVWLDKEDVGLDLSFRRVRIEDLEMMLKEDRERSLERNREWHEQLPEEVRELWLTRLEELTKRLQKEDLGAEIVRQWVKSNCQMDDGLIPLLNFEQMAIHFHGYRHVIKGGVEDGAANLFLYCIRLDCKDGHNLKCPCPRCVTIPATF